MVMKNTQVAGTVEILASKDFQAVPIKVAAPASGTVVKAGTPLTGAGAPTASVNSRDCIEFQLCTPLYYYLIKTRQNPIASRNAVDNISREAIDRKAETVNHLIQGVEYFVSESHFANLFPDLLNGIHFWCIRWNISQVDVRRHFQFV